MRFKLATAILVLPFIVPSARVEAGWERGGVPAIDTTLSVVAPVGVSDGAGGVVVAWTDTDLAFPPTGVYVQRFDKYGSAIWGAGGVRISTYSPLAGSQSIVRSGTGWMVAWCDSRNGDQDVFITHVDSQGVVEQTDGHTVAGNAMNQGSPHMLMIGGGDVMIVYVDESIRGVRAQRVDDNGYLAWGSNGVAVASALEGGSARPHIVSDGAGGGLIIWEFSDFGYFSLYGQRINSDGDLGWSNNVVVSNYSSTTLPKNVVSPYDGGAVIAHNYAGTDVIVQRIDTTGVTHWNDVGMTGAKLCPMWNDAYFDPSISVDREGYAVVAFLRGIGLEAGHEVYAHRLRLTAGLATDWGSDGVRVHAANSAGESSWSPYVVPNSTGGSIIGWRRTEWGAKDVYVQSLDSTGAWYWSAETQLSDGSDGGDIAWPTLIEELDGGSYAIWTLNDSNSDNIYVNRVTRTTEPVVTKERQASKEWRVTFEFDSDSGSDAAVVQHGASGCSQECTYQYADTSSGSSSHLVILEDVGATLAYCYRIIPGGLPIYSGALPLVHDLDYPLRMDLEDASIDTDAICVYASEPPCFSVVEEGDTSYGGYRTGDYYYNPPPRIVGERRMGRNAILVELLSQPPSISAPQRVEIGIENDLPFYQERWTAFSLLMPDTSDLSETNEFNHIMQWYQDNEVGPAMTLTLYTVDGEPVLRLWVVNDDAVEYRKDTYSCVSGNGYIQYDLGAIQNGKWTDVLINTKFDPTNNCGARARVWIDRSLRVDVDNVAIGCSSPFLPGGSCSLPEDHGVKENVRVHKFGLYRRQQERNVVLCFDEMRTGMTRADVELPRIKIFNDTVELSGENGDSVTVSFCTDTLTVATVRYGETASCSGDCALNNSISTNVDTTHSVLLTGLTRSACYRIEATDSQGKVTNIDGYAYLPLAGLAHSVNAVACAITVTWEASPLSDDNTLYYRIVGAPFWDTMDAEEVVCEAHVSCTATFDTSPGNQYEFKVSAEIGTSTYWSNVVTRSIRQCTSPGGTDGRIQEKRKDPILKARPNPFNPITTLSFYVPSRSDVTLAIYSVDGKTVTTLVSKPLDEGVHEVNWLGIDSAGRALPSGIYLMRLVIGSRTLTSKLVLLK